MSTVATNRRLEAENRVVKRLMSALGERASESAGGDLNDVAQRALRQRASQQQRAFADLRRDAYAKVMVYRDENGDKQELRITTVDVAFADPSIHSLGAPLVQSVLALNPGEQADVRTPGGTRTIEVVEVAYLRYSGQQAFQMYRHELTDEECDPPALDLDRQAFILSPTKAQQELTITTRVGERVVTGIAGSGKTGVAVNIMKTVSYADERGTPSDFQPGTALGIVLNRQLVAYLEKDLVELGLGGPQGLRVLAFTELREEMIKKLRWAVSRPTKRGGLHPHFSTQAWFDHVRLLIGRLLANARISELRAVDAKEVARHAVLGLLKSEDAIERLRKLAGDRWEQLLIALEATSSKGGGPESFLPEAERAVKRWCTLPGSPEISGDERVAAWATEGLHTAALAALREDADMIALYKAAMSDETAGDANLESIGDPADVRTSLVELRRRVCAERASLSDPELDVLLALHSRLAREYPALPSAGHWKSFTHGFIDEFQDFSDIQIDTIRSRVTGFLIMLGDPAQRLDRDTIGASASLVPETHLTENKRQSRPLGLLAALVRKDILGDSRPSIQKPPSPTDSAPLRLGDGRGQELDVLKAELISLRARSPNATVAVICPNEGFVERMLACRLELARDSIELERVVTDRKAHVDRHLVYVATSAQLKGLEFEAALVAGLDQYDLTDEIARNMLYVAVSRPLTTCGLSWSGTLSPQLEAVLSGAGCSSSPDARVTSAVETTARPVPDQPSSPGKGSVSPATLGSPPKMPAEPRPADTGPRTAAKPVRQTLKALLESDGWAVDDCRPDGGALWAVSRWGVPAAKHGPKPIAARVFPNAQWAFAERRKAPGGWYTKADD